MLNARDTQGTQDTQDTQEIHLPTPYEITGTFKHKNAYYTFNGTLFATPHNSSVNIIFGSVYDDNNPQRKTVFGLERDRRIEFWKVQPLSVGALPVIYVAKRLSEENNSTGYEGKWGPFENLSEYTTLLTAVPQIMEATVAGTEEEALVPLANIPYATIESYLSSDITDAISNSGQNTRFALKKK